MSSLLGAFSSAVNYVVGGSDEAKDGDSENQGTFAYDPSDVLVSGVGELWKFDKKREEFRHAMSNCTAMIVVRNASEFASSFQVLTQEGSCLFAEDIDNSLQIQYNRKHKSMIWTIFDPSRDKVNVFSFVFENEEDEHDFKMVMAIKLYEFNRGESFERLIRDKVLKEEDRTWVGQSLENEPEQPDDYEETDDLVLDEEVVPAPMDVDSDEDESNEAPDVPRRNRWDAAVSAPVRVPQNQGSAFATINSSPFDNQRQRAVVNKHITGSKCFNRTYVTRETEQGAMLGLYHHNDSNELEYLGKLSLKDVDGEKFTPVKSIQHDEDTRMLFLSEEKPGTVGVMDLNRGQVVEEWEGKQEEMGGIVDIVNITKHEQRHGNPLVYGLNNRAMFMMDGRVPTANKCVGDEQIYKTDPKMSCMATTGCGFMATGAETGQIRLYNKLGMRAKTLLPGLGDAIKSIETTEAGDWILATCKDYLMVMPTRIPGSDRLGYEGRGMGKNKPRPYVLRLKPSDVARYNLRNIDFTAAHFDIGEDTPEHWIVTSTGPYIIKWNFRKLKRNGNVSSYSIRRARSKITANEFRWNHGDDMLVSEADSVYAQHSSRRR